MGKRGTLYTLLAMGGHMMKALAVVMCLPLSLRLRIYNHLSHHGTPMPFSDEQATDTQGQLKRMTDAEREKAAEWALAKLASNPKQTGG